MIKSIEVKEYHPIVCRKKTYAVFEELKTYIEQFDKSDDVADIHDFIRLEHKKGSGYTIKFQNYVGLIQLKDGTQFNILPKIDLGEKKGNEQTKKTFLSMLCSMKNFPAKSFDFAALKAERINLYDIFIRMYLQEVLNLIKKGIQSSYVEEEDNLCYFKGKLLVAQHLRYNLAHKERFYVAFEDYNINRPENKLIKTTLLELQRLTTDAVNLLNIKQLLNVFNSVAVSTNINKDFQKVVKNRETKAYDNIMLWTKIFLIEHNTFSPFGGTTFAKTFLFPMEKVFESYVAEQIKKVFFLSDGWDICCQDERFYFNKSPEMFKVKPDIVLEYNKNKRSKVIVMDTKWKKLESLNADKSNNFGIKSADMYQMYVYSKRYKTRFVWLLYPKTEKTDSIIKEFPKSDVVFTTFDGVEIRIHFVDLVQDKIEENLKDLKKEVYRVLNIKG